MKKKAFGVTSKGENATLFEMENKNGMRALVSDFGANLVSLFVPDKKGNICDVVLGYEDIKDYEANLSFFGAVIGPSANRIAGAEFEIAGENYRLDVNDGVNNLHSDIQKGIHKRIWSVSDEGTNFVKFTIKSPHLDMGFPGNKTISITYTLTEDNEIKLFYEASSDADTIINLTNHSYFNLSGADSGKNIENHLLTLNAAFYTPVVEGAIPTGEIKSVKGSPMDFTKEEAVGKRIREDFEQLKLTQGYDHNYVIDDYDKSLREIAKVYDPDSERTMLVYTDLPGVQFYAGNCIGDTVGKEGAKYTKRSGLCLETQYYPDTIHQPGFPSCVFGPGNDYKSETIYKFV